MCWRQVSKQHVLYIAFYFAVYVVISFAIAPRPAMRFVRDELRVGDKYALMFVEGLPRPVFTDAEGADVFASRRCGSCVVTNNKGFLPMAEYDAILVHGNKNLLSEAEAAMEPGKRYLIETTTKCIRDKFRRCLKEPKITSFGTRESYTLCSLCDDLIRKKQLAP